MKQNLPHLTWLLTVFKMSHGWEQILLNILKCSHVHCKSPNLRPLFRRSCLEGARSIFFLIIRGDKKIQKTKVILFSRLLTLNSLFLAFAFQFWAVQCYILVCKPLKVNLVPFLADSQHCRCWADLTCVTASWYYVLLTPFFSALLYRGSAQIRTFRLGSSSLSCDLWGTRFNSVGFYK